MTRTRTRTRTLFALVLLLVAGCAHHPDAGARSTEGPEPRQDELFAALAGRDAPRVAGFFAEDAVLHVAGMPPVEGRVAIQQFYHNLFRFLLESRLTPGPTVASASRDLAYSTGRTSNTFRGADGATSYGGRYALVWRRLDGEWKVVLYAVSSDEGQR